MPAKSQAQQIAMAIAAHSPNKLFKRNASLKRMPKGQLSEFASTPRKQLAYKIAQSRTKK